MPPKPLIHLPGNTLEGGGQLVRISLGLSSLLSLPIHIPQIRAGRYSGGGLKPQHLTCVNWLSAASKAHTTGAAKKSKELEFWPSPDTAKQRGPFWVENDKKRTITIDIGTPGSITLTVQAVLPFIIFATSGVTEEKDPGEGVIELKVIGGTNVTHSPSVEYLDQVMLPMLSAHILPRDIPPFRVEVSRRAWAVGSSKEPLGEVTFWVPTLPFGGVISGFEMKDRGQITKVCASVIVPTEYISSFKSRLGDEDFGIEMEIVLEEESKHPKRYYLLLVAHTSNGYRLGSDVLYDSHEHKKRAPGTGVVEYMVSRCSAALKREIAHVGCVDEFMHDEVVVFQALADGRSVVYAGEGVGEGSLHTKTARWVAEQFTGIAFSGEGKCSVEGVGLKAGTLEWKGGL